jgi:hypothetical protein
VKLLKFIMEPILIAAAFFAIGTAVGIWAAIQPLGQ